MPDKRRRIFYVDRIFQKRVLFFFLGWNCVVVIANFVFYLGHLRSLVEDNLYRSHIKISNLAQAFLNDVLRFNVLLAAASILAVVLFYLFIRLRIRSFFSKIKGCLQSPLGRSEVETVPDSFSEEFAGIDTALREFFEAAGEKTVQFKERLSFLKEELSNLEN